MSETCKAMVRGFSCGNTASNHRHDGLCGPHGRRADLAAGLKPETRAERNSRLSALSAARDELVRAAVALNAAHSDIALVAPVDPTSAVVSRRLAWSDFRAAVAAYEKLAKP